MMLKNGLIHQTIAKTAIDRFQQVEKKTIGLFKDELGGRIMKESLGLRTKTYAYLMDDDSKRKKAKGTKKLIKR